MPVTKLKNGQLPDTISSKTVDNTNDINTTTTRLKISGGSNGQVLSTDGASNISWITAGGGVSDGDKGDISVTASGATWTIDNGVVTYAKMQDVSATSRLLGRATAGAGDIEEITIGSGLTLTGTTLSAGGGGTSPIVVTKTAIETVTSSTTLQDDDHLYYNSFDSSKTYYIVFELMVTKLGYLTSPTLKFSFSAGANGAYYAPFATGFREAFFVTSITSPGILNNQAHPIVFYASLSGHSGNGKLMWAQGTSSADGVRIMKYSKMTIYELGTT